MKYLVVAVAMAVVSSQVLADRLNEPVNEHDIGRGIIDAAFMDLSGFCFEGTEVDTDEPLKISYRLSVHPDHAFNNDITPNKMYVVTEMIITNRSRSIRDGKTLPYNDFDYACGRQYVAKVALGASVQRSIYVSSEDAKKIAPFESEDAAQFEQAASVELAKVSRIYGWSIGGRGFTQGAVLSDFDLPLSQFFKKFLDRWNNGQYKHAGVIGYSEPYPTLVLPGDDIAKVCSKAAISAVSAVHKVWLEHSGCEENCKTSVKVIASNRVDAYYGSDSGEIYETYEVQVSDEEGRHKSVYSIDTFSHDLGMCRPLKITLK